MVDTDCSTSETRFEIRMQAIGFDKEAVDELKEISPSDRLKPLINSLDTQTHQVRKFMIILLLCTPALSIS